MSAIVTSSWFMYLCILGSALLVTLISVPAAKTIAGRLGAIDRPDARRINIVPTPRMGGIAIFAGLVCAVILQWAGTILWGWPSVLISHAQLDVDYKLLGCAVLVVFLTGFIDDWRGLKPWQKLCGQTLAACIVAVSGLVVGNISNPLDDTVVSIGWLAWPVTVIYLVAFINMINLIDGLDGLAAGICAISCIAMFYLSLAAYQADAAALCCATLGCCLGFLRYNFHPASIFMGDCGSNTLGLLLGIIALLGINRVAAVTTIIVPLVVAGVPIIDTLGAIIRRRRGHTSITKPDKGHIQHRLIKQGFDQRRAALIIYAWSILLAGGAVIMTKVGVWWRIAIFIGLLLISAFFVGKLHLFEPVLMRHYNPQTHTTEIINVDEESDGKSSQAQDCTPKDAEKAAD